MKNYPVFDGHNDTLLKLMRLGASSIEQFLHGNLDAHIDRVRAKSTGYRGAFFAVFTPSKKSISQSGSRTMLPAQHALKPDMSPIPRSHAVNFTNDTINLLHRIIGLSKGTIALINKAEDLKTFTQVPGLSIILHLEGAEAIDARFNNLQRYYKKGLRSLGLVWSRRNIFGSGVSLDFPGSPDVGPGLSEYGIELVKRCNQLGIILDLAHLNEKGFWDVARLSVKPLVVSHAGIHRLCPSPRNLSDRQLEAIANSNGITGITFANGLIRADGRIDLSATLNDIIDHIDYIRKHFGIDYVGFGSDFDGARIAEQLGDVTGILKLIEKLEERGFTEHELRKICYANWLRVIKETLASHRC
ncbi:dipeptidase [bacterium]|nr:dipeptidase [candidate division CSSED10-310 bacterium]